MAPQRTRHGTSLSARARWRCCSWFLARLLIGRPSSPPPLRSRSTPVRTQGGHTALCIPHQQTRSGLFGPSRNCVAGAQRSAHAVEGLPFRSPFHPHSSCVRLARPPRSGVRSPQGSSAFCCCILEVRHALWWCAAAAAAPHCWECWEHRAQAHTHLARLCTCCAHTSSICPRSYACRALRNTTHP